MKNKNEQSTASSLLRFAGPYKGRYVLSICLSVLGVASGLVPYYTAAQILIGLIGTERNFSFYIFWGIIAVVGYLAKSTFAILSTSISHTATFLALRDIRKQIVDKFSRMPMGTLLNTPSGQLKDTLVDRVEGLETPLAHLLPEMSANVLVPVFIVIYLFVLDWRMALISLITIPVGMAFMATILKTYPQQYEGSVKINQQMNNAVVEYVNGIEVIKAFNQSAASYGKYSDAVRDNADYFYKWMKSCQWAMSSYNAICPAVLITVLAIMLLSAYFFLQGTMPLAYCLMMIVASFMIFGELKSAGSGMATLRLAEVSIDRANKLDEVPVMAEGQIDAPPVSHAIEFQNVHFAYEKRTILDGMNFTIPDRTMTAIVGPSGSGKTTICNLIARFWDVNSGRVLIGGQDVKAYTLSELMSNISMVFQNVYLFADTIENNIKFGKPDATHEEVVEAARKACCDDFISALPDGYNTLIGEGGASLSGGEKQRLSIARAMLKNAPIVIFDEATANVDPENEDRLQTAIEELTKDKTIIMIAHRLKTVRNADQIIVVSGGHIVQQGKHDDLIKQKGIYADFINGRKQAIGWKLGANN